MLRNNKIFIFTTITFVCLIVTLLHAEEKDNLQEINEYTEFALKIEGIEPELLRFICCRDGNSLGCLLDQYPDLLARRNSPKTLAAARKWLKNNMETAWKTQVIVGSMIRFLTRHSSKEDLPLVRPFLTHPNSEVRSEAYCFFGIIYKGAANKEVRLAMSNLEFADAEYRDAAIRGIQNENAREEFVHVVRHWYKNATDKEKKNPSASRLKSDAYMAAEEFFAEYDKKHPEEIEPQKEPHQLMADYDKKYQKIDESNEFALKIEGIEDELLIFLCCRDENSLRNLIEQYPDLPARKESPKTLAAARKWLKNNIEIAWKTRNVICGMIKLLILSQKASFDKQTHRERLALK